MRHCVHIKDKEEGEMAYLLMRAMKGGLEVHSHYTWFLSSLNQGKTNLKLIFHTHKNDINKLEKIYFTISISEEVTMTFKEFIEKF